MSLSIGQSAGVFFSVAYWAGRPGLRWSWRVSLRRGLSAFISRITALWHRRPVAATAVVSSGNTLSPALKGGLAVIISERCSTRIAIRSNRTGVSASSRLRSVKSSRISRGNVSRDLSRRSRLRRAVGRVGTRSGVRPGGSCPHRAGQWRCRALPGGSDHPSPCGNPPWPRLFQLCLFLIIQSEPRVCICHLAPGPAALPMGMKDGSLAPERSQTSNGASCRQNFLPLSPRGEGQHPPFPRILTLFVANSQLD